MPKGAGGLFEGVVSGAKGAVRGIAERPKFIVAKHAAGAKVAPCCVGGCSGGGVGLNKLM